MDLRMSPKQKQWSMTVGLMVGAAALSGAECSYIGDPPPVARLELSTRALRLQVGDSARLSATPLDGSGRPIARGVTVGWSSSAPEVALVRAASGVVTGLAPGSVVVIAVARGRTDSVLITVVARTAP
jgi:hypothetical protein